MHPPGFAPGGCVRTEFLFKRLIYRMNSIMFGTVRCFDSRTGAGWISPQSGERDVRVLASAVNRANLGQLSRGQTLGFTVAQGSRTAEDLWATWSNR